VTQPHDHALEQLADFGVRLQDQDPGHARRMPAPGSNRPALSV
jgi:hypothetical protein